MSRTDAIGFFWQDIPPEKKPKAEKLKRTAPARTWENPDYLPGLAEALAFNVPMFSTAELIQACANRERLLFDIEIYPNYFLAAFASLTTGKVIYFEATHMTALDAHGLYNILTNFTTVGFNSNPFDMPIAALACAGKSVPELKHAADQMIVEQVRPSDLLRSHRVKKLQVDTIDLIEVAPLSASLKIYAGRLHAPKMQDLPFHPSTVLSPEQIAIVRFYCINDLTSTAFLHECLKDQISLRESMSAQYCIDLRSKSDAQIAEAVITHELEILNRCRVTRPSIEPGTCYSYDVPSFISYQTPMMNQMLRIVQRSRFVVADSGSIAMPPELSDLEIRIAGSVYRMGIGGLHSSEESTFHVAGNGIKLRDIDVESFYPRIILNLGLYPKHLGANFLTVYDAIVRRRLGAKAAGGKVIADSLKIVINGSYGKLGSKYSNLYAPDLLIQVTITGQLSLLMLIETLELNGINVVSANTDGIVTKYHESQEALLDKIIDWWQACTGFKMEGTQYAALYSRDVNSYIAVKPDGKTKTKGAFANPWADTKNPAMRLHKNPSCQICVEAVEGVLTKGTPVMTTLQACKDIRKFVAVRYVRHGAVKLYDEPEAGAPNQEYLGKAVRWYYSTSCPGDMVSAASGNLVPKSKGARPLMELPAQLPLDIDLEWYEAEAHSMLEDLGYYRK